MSTARPPLTNSSSGSIPTARISTTPWKGEFRIGTAYLEGRKQKILGVPTLPSRDRAIAIFSIITNNAPFSRYAPSAEFKIGQGYETERDYKSAVTAYQKVVDKYPTDPLAADALYQIAYCFQQVATKTGSYDKANTQRAREGYEDFLAQYPNHEKASQARENLGSLASPADRRLAANRRLLLQASAVPGGSRVLQRRDPPAAQFARQHPKAKARLDTIRSKYGEKYFSEASPNSPGSGLKPVLPKVGDGRLQAQTDTAKRPDYVGPPVSAPTPPSAPAKQQQPNLFGPPLGNDGTPAPASSAPRPDATPLPVPAGDQPSLPAQ